MEQAKQLLDSYLKVTQHMSRQFRCYFRKLELTYPQTLVLAVLAEDGEIPISHLARRIDSANSTVSGIVDRLEKLGLVERVRSGKDRRVIYVTVTEKYRSLQEKMAPTFSAHLAKKLKDVPTEEMAAICDGLQKMDLAMKDLDW